MGFGLFFRNGLLPSAYMVFPVRDVYLEFSSVKGY